MLLTTGQNNQKKNQESKTKHDKLKKQTNQKEKKCSTWKQIIKVKTKLAKKNNQKKKIKVNKWKLLLKLHFWFWFLVLIWYTYIYMYLFDSLHVDFCWSATYQFLRGMTQNLIKAKNIDTTWSWMLGQVTDGIHGCHLHVNGCPVGWAQCVWQLDRRQSNRIAESQNTRSERAEEEKSSNRNTDRKWRLTDGWATQRLSAAKKVIS